MALLWFPGPRLADVTELDHKVSRDRSPCSSAVRELAEKRFRVSKVGRVEIFGEVAVDPRQQAMRVCAFVQPTPQAAQTQRGSKLQRFRVLRASDLQRLCKRLFGLLMSGRRHPQQEFT